MNIGSQLSNSILLVIPISKRLYSIIVLCQCCMILISLNMPHFIVINRWNRPFWVYNTWPNRSTSFSLISYSHALSIIFFDSALALAYPPSLFATWININLAYDFVTERIKLALAWVKIWLHSMCGLISAQTLHRFTCLLHNVIQRRLLATTTGTLKKWAVVSRIHFYLTTAESSLLKIEISCMLTRRPQIIFLLWTCLFLGEQNILFRLLKITLILTWKLFLNDFLSLLLRDRKSMFLQIHTEIHLECSSFLLLLIIIMNPEANGSLNLLIELKGG